MEKRKNLILVLCLLIIAVVIMGFFVTTKKELKIIIDPDGIFTYSNRNWKSEKNRSKFNKKDYDIYLNGVNKGKFDAKFDKKENIYVFTNQKNKKGTISDSFLAIKGKINYDVKKIATTEFDSSDKVIVDSILKENGITYDYKNIPVQGKLNIDLNNDSKIERIYFLSNTFDDLTNPKAFSIIALIDNNGKIYYIHREIVNKANIYDICMPYIHDVIDVEKNGNLEVIASCSYYSSIGTKHYIFTYDNEYRELSTNKIKK